MVSSTFELLKRNSTLEQVRLLFALLFEFWYLDFSIQEIVLRLIVFNFELLDVLLTVFISRYIRGRLCHALIFFSDEKPCICIEIYYYITAVKTIDFYCYNWGKL